jgi:hypothetical protein
VDGGDEDEDREERRENRGKEEGAVVEPGVEERAAERPHRLEARPRDVGRLAERPAGLDLDAGRERPDDRPHVPLQDAPGDHRERVVVEDDLRRRAPLHVALEVPWNRHDAEGAPREDLVESLAARRVRPRDADRLRRVEHPEEAAREERAVPVDDGDRELLREPVPEDRRREGEARERQEDEEDEGVAARHEPLRFPPRRAEDSWRAP